MIGQLNKNITILTGEIELLQSDKATGLYIFAFQFQLLPYYDFKL